ncbi:GNAT family N-acetyltransferase [Plantibacter sp. VKM Ac-2880]|uniref:GNAT family N-acetyltransferase n=1 Tax=Plantibacter sp. VKM Ac-2880 TaxID=2783827 RepID=UPI00188EB8F4|nr:GNAT family N-acetyltransferase [Plantibacter sp. VKM Ac-2880]MBF4569103.1 GNAT family N-acetyltransferase [Plantibacter sp. VKM Ac-2880]
MTSDVDLGRGVVLRAVTIDDSAALADAYRKNRDHLAPWDPERSEAFYTEGGQEGATRQLLLEQEAGAALPLVLADSSRIVGRVNLTGIVRGAFQSGNLGYWIDADHAGRGLMTAAVGVAVDLARDDLRLHRIQAGTLPHNVASQTVLKRCGFVEFGLAPEYLRIAGRWQDHRLFQRILTR